MLVQAVSVRSFNHISLFVGLSRCTRLRKFSLESHSISSHHTAAATFNILVSSFVQGASNVNVFVQQGPPGNLPMIQIRCSKSSNQQLLHTIADVWWMSHPHSSMLGWVWLQNLGPLSSNNKQILSKATVSPTASTPAATTNVYGRNESYLTTRPSPHPLRSSHNFTAATQLPTSTSRSRRHVGKRRQTFP